MNLIPFCKLARTSHLKSAPKASTNSSKADSKRKAFLGSDRHQQQIDPPIQHLAIWQHALQWHFGMRPRVRPTARQPALESLELLEYCGCREVEPFYGVMPTTQWLANERNGRHVGRATAKVSELPAPLAQSVCRSISKACSNNCWSCVCSCRLCASCERCAATQSSIGLNTSSVTSAIWLR